MKSAFCIFAISTSIVIGCSPSVPETQVEQEKPKVLKAPLSEYEATLNPSDFDKEVDIATAKSVDKVQVQPQVIIPQDSMTIQEEVVQGFRIQIFSTSNIDEANVVKALAQEKFTKDSIYIVYDSPVYKVRLGDFASRYDAGQRLPQFVDLGYRDAWIVPDRVIIRKLIPVARPLPK